MPPSPNKNLGEEKNSINKPKKSSAVFNLIQNYFLQHIKNNKKNHLIERN